MKQKKACRARDCEAARDGFSASVRGRFDHRLQLVDHVRFDEHAGLFGQYLRIEDPGEHLAFQVRLTRQSLRS